MTSPTSFGMIRNQVFCSVMLCSLALAFIQVDPKTQFFVDESGRIRLFHGVNAVYKVPPWYPQTTGFDSELSLSDLDAKNLSSWGFNFVRLGVMWPGLEPTPGQYDSEYLDQIETIVNSLAAQGVYVLLDLHQDAYSRKYCGEGVPDWAVGECGLKFPLPIGLPLPTNHTNGYPDLDACDKLSFGKFYFADAVGCSFQTLYDNHTGLATHLDGFWDAVSARFANATSVIGFELINEPWPGDIYKDEYLLLEPGAADKKHAMPLYQRLHRVIRKNDDRHIIFYEKTLTDMLWPAGFSTGPGGPAYNNRQAYSYHVYCVYGYDQQGNPRNLVNCENSEDFSFALVFNDFKRLGGGGFLTEFGDMGNGTNTDANIEFITSLADTHLQSWSYWQFKEFKDLTTWTLSNEGLYLNGQLNVDKLKALSRTYAQATAGVPMSMAFSSNTSDFQFLFRANTTISAPTVIYYNGPLYYPRGLNVKLEPYGTATYNVGVSTVEVNIVSGTPDGTVISVSITAL